MKLNTLQIGLILLVVLLTVLLFSARTTPDTSIAAVREADPIELQIDSAIALVNGEQPMQGILLLRSIAEENPDNLRAQLNLGIFSLQTGQIEKAEARLKTVLELDPENAEGHFFMGHVSKAKGNAAEAVMYFQRSQELTTDNSLKQEIDRLLTELKN